MVSPIDRGENTTPTEEIYLELQELESIAEDNGMRAEPDEPAPQPRGEDGPNSIPARIARLRALLRDRGVSDRP